MHQGTNALIYQCINATMHQWTIVIWTPWVIKSLQYITYECDLVSCQHLKRLKSGVDQDAQDVPEPYMKNNAFYSSIFKSSIQNQHKIQSTIWHQNNTIDNFF